MGDLMLEENRGMKRVSRLQAGKSKMQGQGLLHNFTGDWQDLRHDLKEETAYLDRPFPLAQGRIAMKDLLQYLSVCDG